MYRSFLKRLFDMVFSLVGILMLLPIYLVISILIKWRMPGPVLFAQTRIGRFGRPFTIFKFRTMTVADKTESAGFAAGNASRVTSLGRLLRKAKIDELPQLFNVLRGDMSIVGPRPEVPVYTEFYPEKWLLVHSVRPGITDYASIHFRNEEELLAAADDPVAFYRQTVLPRKLDLNLWYVQQHSILIDLKIIFSTFFSIVSR